jgi:hypothetical protein
MRGGVRPGQTLGLVDVNTPSIASNVLGLPQPLGPRGNVVTHHFDGAAAVGGGVMHDIRVVQMD